MRKVVAILGFVGFGVSLFAHLLTYESIDLRPAVPWFWALHIGILAVVIPFFVSLRPAKLSKKTLWRSYFDPLPAWERYAMLALPVYVLANFALFSIVSGGGWPEAHDGQYILQNSGQLIRELTAVEYNQQQAYFLRGVSGLWIFLYLIPALHFWRPRLWRSVR